MAEVMIPHAADIHDPSFDRSICSRLKITLDGIEQRSVTAYDIDRGEVTRHVLDDDGNPRLNEARDAVLTETVKGSVTVTLQPEHAQG